MKSILSHIVQSNLRIIRPCNEKLQRLHHLHTRQIGLNRHHLIWHECTVDLMRRKRLFSLLLLPQSLLILLVHDGKNLLQLKLVQMPIGSPCNKLRIGRVIVAGHHVKNWVGKQEPSYKLILSRIIEVQELIICWDAINSWLFWNWNVYQVVYYHPSKGNVLYRLVWLFLQ